RSSTSRTSAASSRSARSRRLSSARAASKSSAGARGEVPDGSENLAPFPAASFFAPCSRLRQSPSFSQPRAKPPPARPNANGHCRSGQIWLSNDCVNRARGHPAVLVEEKNDAEDQAHRPLDSECGEDGKVLRRRVRHEGDWQDRRSWDAWSVLE